MFDWFVGGLITIAVIGIFSMLVGAVLYAMDWWRGQNVRPRDIFTLHRVCWMILKQFYYAVLIWRALRPIKNRFRTGSPRIVNILSFGARGIDTCNLAIVHVFENEEDLATAKATGLCKTLTDATFEALAAFHYPIERVLPDQVGFAAQTAINEAGGGFRYFK